MTPGIHEYEYSRLPVLMNMNNVFKYKCVSNLQVKPGYTRKSPGIELYPRNTRARVHMPRNPTPRVPAPTAARTACSSTRTAPCVLATSAKRQHRSCARHGLQAAVRTTRSCQHSANIEAVLGMRLCDPDQLIGKKRCNKLTAADNTICYLTRGEFGEDEHDSGFTDTRWVELEELYENCGTDERLSGGRKHVVSVCV